MVARLQVKASQIGKLLQTLETKASDENNKKTANQLSKQKSECGPPNKKSHYIDPIPPFNANKIRKSPSASLTSDAAAAAAAATATTSTSLKTSASTVNTLNTSSAQKDATNSMEASK